MKNISFVFIFLINFTFQGQEIALLKYNGGGDWYANPTSLPNLIQFCNDNIGTKISQKPATVFPGSNEIFGYSFIHMTGHGNVVFNDQEQKNLRTYLLAGGFLHIDDNYGMDQYIRKELKKLFPDQELIELPANHEIFQYPYEFKNGLPKIHEHEGNSAQAFAILINDRIAVLYTFETDLGDGWEDAEVHNNNPVTRRNALQMGANIIHYVFQN
jgi:hypothetical protein